MKMKSLSVLACGIVALAVSGCHFDEPYFPARSHHHGSYHGQSYGRGYYGDHYRDDYEHRAAHHAEHDYYDHDY